MKKINWKQAALRIFVMVCFGVVGIFVGSYGATLTASSRCDTPPQDCGRALESCEFIANQIHHQLYSTERELAHSKQQFELCEEATTIWYTRANQCASLLGQVKVDCSN